MSVVFSSKILESRKGPRRALVITPATRIVLGHEQLDQLRATSGESPIDDSIVGRIEASSVPHPVVIFRGANDEGTGSWGFAEDLEPDDAYELARHLVLSHLPTQRAMLVHGAYVMVHTDFGSLEADLFRRASKEVHDEMHGARISDQQMRAMHEANVWILRHLNFYFSLSYQKVITEVLPDKLPLIEMRSKHIQALVDAILELG